MAKKAADPETQVRSWGFPHVFTWTDGPFVLLQTNLNKTNNLCRNAHHSPHSHRGLTTHLILKGELTITYPKDKDPTKTTYGFEERIDVDAGRIHEVWMGGEGCTYVIGE